MRRPAAICGNLRPRLDATQINPRRDGKSALDKPVRRSSFVFSIALNTMHKCCRFSDG